MREYELKKASVTFEVRVEPKMETKKTAREAVEDYILLRTEYDPHDELWSFDVEAHPDGGYSVTATCNNCP